MYLKYIQKSVEMGKGKKQRRKERSEQKKNGEREAERGGGRKQDWKNNLLGSENYFSFLGFSPWMIWFHFKGWLENTIRRYKAWVYKSIWWRTMKLSRSSLLTEKMKKNYYYIRSKKKKVQLYFLSQTKVRHPKPSCHDAHESCNKEHWQIQDSLISHSGTLPLCTKR